MPPPLLLHAVIVAITLESGFCCCSSFGGSRFLACSKRKKRFDSGFRILLCFVLFFFPSGVVLVRRRLSVATLFSWYDLCLGEDDREAEQGREETRIKRT